MMKSLLMASISGLLANRGRSAEKKNEQNIGIKRSKFNVDSYASDAGSFTNTKTGHSKIKRK